ncbi:DUF3857 domain-containing protein [Fulvivirga ligni]|uniref:DUF3857 domain-containing protein n=1 Tax=Fulvivirga ligni TaxID=2904246 RepID=UPI001F340BAE|nr:DUF3857 domain-containing protein [Fulvivirga ligni]UII24179.1 DUF3857 domain-containing protein [Fulvivirga ligni]
MRTKFFKSLLLLAFFLTTNLSSLYAVNDNPKRSAEVRESMWNGKDESFYVTDIPDKWKDESAVIIAKLNLLSYKKSVMVSNLSYDNYSHYRIKLLDKKAVEEYSQFTIPESSSELGKRSEIYVGFKVIKADGTEMIIPMSQAVKEEANLDKKGYNSLKLAIPNLEVGDIIDYYMGEDLNFNPYSQYYSFDPVIFQLHDSYPIMKQKISFDVMRRCFINLRTLNGAPSFEFVEDEENDKNYYLLEDGNRESVDGLRWFYPYRQLPAVKFKVIYAGPKADSGPMFLGKPGVLKSEISEMEVSKLCKYLYNSMYLTGDFAGYMKEHFRDEKDKDKLAREAYYVLRGLRYINYEEDRTIHRLRFPKQGSLTEHIFMLSRYYKRAGIKHEMLIGIPRSISAIDDLILENELVFMLKVNTENPFYVSEFGVNRSLGNINPMMEGTKVYTWDMNDEYSDFGFFNVPVAPSSANLTKSETNVQIMDFDEDKVQFQLKRSVRGENKSYYQDLLMDFYTYKKEEAKRFEIKDIYDTKKKEAERLKAKKSKYMEDREAELNEALKTAMGYDYDMELLTVDSLEVLKTGRYGSDQDFVYTCNVEAKGAVKKAGRNYLFDIGKFIDMQIKLTDEDRSRFYDIYMPYARSFEYTITFDIPEGYSVEGVEDLNVDVNNEAGGYYSKAEVKGNKLIIDTKKYYNHNFEKADQWGNMVAFLDEAYNFTQKKVLLKKL